MEHQLKRILFVEDDPEFSDLISEMRKRVVRDLFCGTAELVIVKSLELVKYIVASNCVSLIILDLTIPPGTKEETIDFIHREYDKLPPIYVLTGDESIQTRRECLFAGAAGFAIKKHAIDSPEFFFASLLNMFLKYSPHAS